MSRNVKSFIKFSLAHAFEAKMGYFEEVTESDSVIADSLKPV